MKRALIEILRCTERDNNPYHDDWWESQERAITVVRTICMGNYAWGPFKYNKRSKQEHKGTSIILLENWRKIYMDRNIEEKRKNIAEQVVNRKNLLTDHGFEVKVRERSKFYEPFFMRGNGPRKRIKWATNIPPAWIQKKINDQYLGPTYQELK